MATFIHTQTLVKKAHEWQRGKNNDCKHKHYSQTRPIAQMHAQHRKQTHIATDCSDLDVCLPTLLLQMEFENKKKKFTRLRMCLHYFSCNFAGFVPRLKQWALHSWKPIFFTAYQTYPHTSTRTGKSPWATWSAQVIILWRLRFRFEILLVCTCMAVFLFPRDDVSILRVLLAIMLIQ